MEPQRQDFKGEDRLRGENVRETLSSEDVGEDVQKSTGDVPGQLIILVTRVSMYSMYNNKRESMALSLAAHT